MRLPSPPRPVLPLVSLAAALGLGAAAPAPLHPADVAGSYHRHIQGELMNGEEYGAEDVLEVVPVSPAAAYVRTRLHFGNGHLCELAGVFDAEGPALVFHDPQRLVDGPSPCVLTLRVHGRRLEFDDGRETCQSYCGERGSWEGDGFPLSARRPITYMARLRRSAEYVDALAAHAHRRPPGAPAPPHAP